MYSQTVDVNDNLAEAGLRATVTAGMTYGEESLKSATWKGGIGARQAIFWDWLSSDAAGDLNAAWDASQKITIERTPEEIAERKAESKRFWFCGLIADVQCRPFPFNRLELIYKDQPIASIDITGIPGFEDYPSA